MKGKRLTDEEKKERFDKYISIVLNFKTDTYIIMNMIF